MKSHELELELSKPLPLVSFARLGRQSFAVFVRRIGTRSFNIYAGRWGTNRWGVRIDVLRWTRDGYPAFMVVEA